MEKMSFFTKLYKSMSDFKAYYYFKKEKMSKAFLYLFLLTLTIGLLGVIRPVYEFNKFVDILQVGFQEKVEDFTFSNGELQVKSNEPIVFGGNNSSGIVIIDTNGTIDKSVLDNYSNGVLVLKDRAYNKKNSIETQEISFEEMRELSFTKNDINKLIPGLKIISALMIIFIPIGFFIKNMFTAMIVGIFGMIICAIKKVEERFGNLYKLSLYAITLPAVIHLSLRSLKLTLPHSYKLYCLIAVVYLYLGIKAIKEKEAEEFNEIYLNTKEN